MYEANLKNQNCKGKIPNFKIIEIIKIKQKYLDIIILKPKDKINNIEPKD